jgi:choline dehydrogenase-like flavoprotein
VTPSPDPNQKDKLQIPKPRIAFQPSDYQLAAFVAGQKVIAEVFKALGATETQFPKDPKAYSSANHIMGTCRMGTDPKQSVVTPECQSHDHRNLFIIGSSVFPTAGTANPTLTALAVLLRSLPTIEDALRQNAGVAP